MTDGPLDERCTDCGALVDACRCPDNIDVDDDPIVEVMNDAAHHVSEAVEALISLRQLYRYADVTPPIRAARLRSIESKIALLHDIKLDPNAYPWSTDA